jgi:tetratricopeptide (TPR) repeat protein
MSVKAWIEKVSIPTYKVGTPEKNPMFLEKRVYQGSSGVVYPHAVIEKIADEKEDQEYTAVYLENEYLLIMVLPEIGGRIQRAYDKVRKRDFVYYNQVIKPALVGLAGPWISGGIEFNWPQHHRPSTFSPVDYTIEENEDGSKTVWVNETELMFRTKGMAGFTLYPGKAYLEIKGRLFNRSPFSQTFLWWANPAVKVNEHYQSVFPPDVYAVFDHGKRDVSDFPIATGTYYKVDYAPGTDISRYSTIPVPTSYMAIRSDYDFIGSYEHDTQAGMLHVADHHLSPGKKQWTWGNGDFGFAWDRNLTDEDGPYIELMTGVFTDNQPDFSWLQPNEVKSFEQYFMPYTLVGAVKNATKEAMLNIENNGNTLTLKVYTTAVYDNALVKLYKDGALVQTYTSTISPEAVFINTYEHSENVILTDWRIEVADKEDKILVAWQPEAATEKTIPPAATAAKLPAEIEQVEDLYLNGLHLEQYRHATYNPVDYYEEGLRRSSGDIRCNNAMGLLLLRRGQFEKAEPYFRKAIATMTSRNPNPYDGEAYYNLGWSLLMQDKLTTAYEAFYKATWNDAWQHSAFLALARIAARQNKLALAIEHIEKSLVRNYHSHTARHIKVVLLRKTGKSAAALAFLDQSTGIDPFNNGCHYERYLLLTAAGNETAAGQALQQLQLSLRNNLNNYLELSLDYAHAGFYTEAMAILQLFATGNNTASPLVYYYMGWYASQAGDATATDLYYTQAQQQAAAGCFPNKIEEVIILQAAIARHPHDATALYALGNFWYDKRQYTVAIDNWEKATVANDRFATPFRNLSLAYYNKLKDVDRAIQYLEKAFALDTTDARVFMELDQLYKITGKTFEERLQLLEQYPALVNDRDDLYLEWVTLQNNLGNYEKTKELLSNRKFHPWEGGEGKVVGQFLLYYTALAKQALRDKNYEQVITLLQQLEKYPDNLGEGKLYGAQENDIHYLLGCAYEGLQEEATATRCFQQATIGISQPVQAIYYNDPQPDKIVYQALAWKKLGNENKAQHIFEQFIRFGEQHYNDDIKIDYFAVSLPDMLVFDIDINQRNRVHCIYLEALGYLGLQQEAKATELLQQVLATDPNHQGAATHLQMRSFFSPGKMAETIAEQ